MLEIDYNQKFRTFFKKFEEKYKKATTKDEKDFLWDLAVEYIEKNRDFIMQYPLASYWNKIDLPLAPSLIRSGNNKDTSQKEVKNFLEEYNNKDVNLYFHIPFCKTKCSYCNFHIVVGENKKNLLTQIYLTKLKKEIDFFVENVSDFNIKTIFIGGGTPSFLNEEELKDLLSYINKKLGKYFSNDLEFCFEGNPDSFNEKKLKILKNHSINRLSFGVQTFNNDILKKVNRTHLDKNTIELVKLSKKLGFDNINIDMLYGLPGHTEEIMQKDLEIISKLDIEHITYYPLYKYEESILGKINKKENNYKNIYNFYDKIIEKLGQNGFKQYGREYFCKNNKISNYQSNFLSNSYVYGFGQSANSFSQKYVFRKETDLNKYLEKTHNIVEYFEYDKQTFDRRLFILGSRHIKIQKNNIKKVANIEKVISMCIYFKLLIEHDTYYKVSKKGLKYQEVLSHLFV